MPFRKVFLCLWLSEPLWLTTCITKWINFQAYQMWSLDWGHHSSDLHTRTLLWFAVLCCEKQFGICKCVLTTVSSSTNGCAWLFLCAGCTKQEFYYILWKGVSGGAKKKIPTAKIAWQLGYCSSVWIPSYFCRFIVLSLTVAKHKEGKPSVPAFVTVWMIWHHFFPRFLICKLRKVFLYCQNW